MFASNGLELELYLIIFLSAILVVFSVFASRLSSLLGVPALVLFLGIGMLAGSDGLGGIEFNDYSLSFALCSICLALIIFDGGMRTSWKSIRPIIGTGASLSILGVVFTFLIVAIFAHYIFSLDIEKALLLGAIVSSTDAAAVFSILKSKGLTLTGNVKQSLEFEAGSNDPMAIFLTTLALMILTSQLNGYGALSFLFFTQMGIGLVGGWVFGHLSKWIINYIQLEYEGLYSVLVLGLVFVIFGGVSLLGGSGFLAVYIAGITLGNTDILHKGSIFKFHDGVAWVAQIFIFLILGLLVFPSNLIPVWREGIILSFFLMFVARPISVFLSTLNTKFSVREKAFISWVGLRGAAPIILAILPMIYGVENAEYYFSLVFFVVLTSVLAQGISIPWVAKQLNIVSALNEREQSPQYSDILPEGIRFVEINVSQTSNACNKRIVDLSVPGGVIFTRLKRDGRFLVPKGETYIYPKDQIWGLVAPNNEDYLKETFGHLKYHN